MVELKFDGESSLATILFLASGVVELKIDGEMPTILSDVSLSLDKMFENC